MKRRHSLLAIGLLIIGVAEIQTAPQTRSFAAEIAALSEPSGYFDTDNLISNERSYLHVIGDLAQARLKGGAYIGVGPDQNFSYIAQVQPAVAYLMDIRRDNLLLHLLFKSIFALSRSRIEYLAVLFGRPPPDAAADWSSRTADALAAYLDKARPLTAAERAALDARVAKQLAATGVPLSDGDRATIARFHGRFIADGLWLQFNSTGRAPQPGYPTYRDLMLEVDRTGTRRSFLETEAAFQVVKSLQDRDLIIPVVGDLAGPSALARIGEAIGGRGEHLSTFYASNVEFYLFRDGRFPQFIANLGRLPRAGSSVIIRSVFGGYAPVSPGYNSASLVQPIGDLVTGFAAGRFRQYGELTGRGRAPQVW